LTYRFFSFFFFFRYHQSPALLYPPTPSGSRRNCI
jgi:hypothetical protein